MRTTFLTAIPLLAAMLTTSVVGAATKKFDDQMAPLIEVYLKMQESLAADKFEGVSAMAARFNKQALALDTGPMDGAQKRLFNDLPKKLTDTSAGLVKATTIDNARVAFRELSKPMAMWVSSAKPAGVVVVYCSMYPGSWLQRAGEVRNPYYGAKMLTCGEVVTGK
jgi:hypothetical protein